MEWGADPDIKGPHWHNSLSSPCWRGDLESVKILVEVGGCDVDLYCEDTTTGIMVAAEHGHLDVVRYLKEKGAGLNRRDSRGYTPFLYAAVHGKLEVARYLLQFGPDPNGHMRHGDLPLDRCCWSEEVFDNLVFLVEEAGADVNARSRYHGSALWTAAGRGCTKAVR